MSSIKDQAVFIRLRNYSETSQIVTLFSRSSGKIHALAKGSHRSRGKFGGGIDLLTAGEILFIPARAESSLALLTEFDLRESFPLLRRDLLALNSAQYIAELLNLFTEELDPHEKLYDQFIISLRQLEQNKINKTVLLLQFELSLLREIGLAPDWERCYACGRKLPSGPCYFSSSNSGMICRDCEPTEIEKYLVSPRILPILSHPDQAPSTPSSLVMEAHRLLCYHLRKLAGKTIPVMDFLNQLLIKQETSP